MMQAIAVSLESISDWGAGGGEMKCQCVEVKVFLKRRTY